jgi:ABC-type dipeptide/oligopeptide/nickel transport system ATPase component
VGRQIAGLLELNPELLDGPDAGGGWSWKERRRRARRRSIESLDLVKIPDPGRTVPQYPLELSGRMQQRVVTARA